MKASSVLYWTGSVASVSVSLPVGLNFGWAIGFAFMWAAMLLVDIRHELMKRNEP